MIRNTISSIFVATHGDNAFYLMRFLTNLYQHTAHCAFDLQIGLNGVGIDSLRLAHSARREYGNVSIHSEPNNIYKSPLMAKLFSSRPIDTDWIIWFDDDSYPYRNDWLQGLNLKMQAQPEVDVWGNQFFTEADDQAVEFIRSADWYQGVPMNHVKPDGERSKRPLLTFVEGGFWAIKTSVIKALNWPDPRLVQHEDDYIFGEALRQNRFRIGQYTSGIRISDAERRCPPNTPCSYETLPAA